MTDFQVLCISGTIIAVADIGFSALIVWIESKEEKE